MKNLMKKCVAIIVSILLLISCYGTVIVFAAPQIQILAPAGQNLITNGDFESQDSTGWAFGEGVSIAADAKRSGSYGLKLPAQEWDTKANFEFSQIALAPNTTYTVTADVATNGTGLSVDFNVTGGEVDVQRGTLPSSWANVTILTITTKTEYVYGKIAFEIYRGGSGVAYVDNVRMIATGNEWCPTPTGGMTMGTGINETFDEYTLVNGTLDKNVWLVSNTAWGGDNGGLDSANVKLGTVDGKKVCILESHGDKYTGNIEGVGENTHRVGAGIVTRDYYASGRYTVVCKIEPQLGVCTAFWSFSYIGYMQDDKNGDGRADYYDDGDGLWEYNKLHAKDANGWIQENGVRNSEIDWETPSPMDNSNPNDVVSHNNLRTNCWGGKRPGEGGNYSGRSHQQNNATLSIADGQWHELVYELFTLDNPYTSKVNDPAVVWFIDGKLVDSYDSNNTEYIANDNKWFTDEQMGAYLSNAFNTGGIEVPRYGMRFWLATWFPVKAEKLYCVGQEGYSGWAGTPDYDTTYTYLDKVEIIPYSNGGTAYAKDTNNNPISVKAQYLGDDGKDLGDEFNVIETVPNKQFALPSEYPNYAQSVGTLDAPTPVTVENGSVVTLSWNNISGATDYDVMIDGVVKKGVTSPYQATGLNIGNHRFKVRARNSTKTGIWSYDALVSVGTPKNVQVTVVGHSLNVTWDPVPGALDYYMEIDNNPIIVNGAFISFKSGEPSGYLQGFGDNTTHHIRVKAIGAKGQSNWSGLVEAKVTGNGVPIPELNLKNSDSNIYAFEAIINRIEGGTAYELMNQETKQIINVPINQWGYPTMEFTNIAPGIYYYSARAQKGGVWSDWSTMKSITVAPNEILEAPGVHADAIDGSSVDIWWNDVTKATGYDIEIDGNVISNVTSPYHHTGLTEGQTYSYRVRSKNSSQTSVWSNYAYAIPGGGGGGGGGGEDPIDDRYTGNGTIKNGGFDNGETYWVTAGGVTLQNGAMKVTGSDVDSILSQTVFGCKPNTNYTLTADFTGNTSDMYVYVRRPSGELACQVKDLPYTFNTGAMEDNGAVTIIFSLYRGLTANVTIDNVSLSEGNVVTSATSSNTSNTSNITPPPGGIFYGDANDDKTVDMKDVLAIRKHIAHLPINGTFIEANANANGDSSIDMKDVLLVRKFIAHLVTKMGPN